MTLFLRFAASSDVGRVRRDNQDSGYAGPHLLVVADGVGGAARGDIASSATVETMRKLDAHASHEPLGSLGATIQLAHDRLAEIVEAHSELEGTSTTLTAATFDGAQLSVGHVGDSRGYLLRDGAIKQFTSDHSLVQSLVDEGRITEEEARVHPHRNLILKAIDSVHEPEPDLFTVPVQAGDRLLLCTDGCSGVLEAETLATMLAADSLDAIAVDLVHAALDAGSSDNVTVVVAEVVEGDTTSVASSIVVGAAASTPHLQIPDTETGNLTEGDLEELSSASLDPETIRYAPLPPPRRLALRRSILLLVVLALIGGAGYGGWTYSQSRNFIKPDPNGHVLLYKGIDVSLLGFKFYEPQLDTGYLVGELDEAYAKRVQNDHPSVSGLTEARENLRESCERALSAEEPEAPLGPFGIPVRQPEPVAPIVTPDCAKGF